MGMRFTVVGKVDANLYVNYSVRHFTRSLMRMIGHYAVLIVSANHSSENSGQRLHFKLKLHFFVQSYTSMNGSLAVKSLWPIPSCESWNYNQAIVLVLVWLYLFLESEFGLSFAGGWFSKINSVTCWKNLLQYITPFRLLRNFRLPFYKCLGIN